MREARVTIAGFPRRNRRGLIEAGIEGGICLPGGVGFPGEIAGASLKRIPGGGRIQSSAWFPRRNRRGLIEASRTTCNGRSALRVSPAKSPGPH